MARSRSKGKKRRARAAAAPPEPPAGGEEDEAPAGRGPLAPLDGGDGTGSGDDGGRGGGGGDSDSDDSEESDLGEGEGTVEVTFSEAEQAAINAVVATDMSRDPPEMKRMRAERTVLRQKAHDALAGIEQHRAHIASMQGNRGHRHPGRAFVHQAE